MINQYGFIPENITEDDFNDTQWFANFDALAFTRSLVYLPRGTHWNEKALFWGNYDSDSITITPENESVRDIYVSLDLRRDYSVMLTHMLHSLSSNHLMVLDEALNIFYPDDDIYNRIKTIVEYRNDFFNSDGVD